MGKEKNAKYSSSMMFLKEALDHQPLFILKGPRDVGKTKVSLEELEMVEQFFENFYSKITQAKTDNVKLTEIASLCRNLEILHCYPDGNQRTIVFAI